LERKAGLHYLLLELDPEEPLLTMTVAEARERSIADCKGRKLAKETIAKYELLVNKRRIDRNRELSFGRGLSSPAT